MKGLTTMFWVCFWFGKRTKLVVMKGDERAKKGGATKERCLEVLKKHLRTILDNDSIFMQDNAPINTAIIAEKHF